MHQALVAFVEHLSAIQASPLTIKRYQEILRELDSFSQETPTPGLERPALQKFASTSRKDGQARSPAGTNLRVAALRSLWKFLLAEGHTSTNPAAELVCVPEPRRVPKFLTTAETRHLADHVASRSGPHARRNRALLIVFWQTALRVSEVANLKVAQLDPETKLLRDVRVKGGHVFDVALNDQTLSVLTAYLRERGPLDGDKPLFARADGRPLSVRAIQAVFSAWRVDLGWTRPLHPHVLRHTHATAALALGVDIATVADLLRHKGLRTVMVYAAVQDGARRDALTKLGRLVPGSVFDAGAPEHPSSAPPAPIRNTVTNVQDAPCVDAPFDEAA